MSFCTKCGTDLQKEALFCPNCGQPIQVQQEPLTRTACLRAESPTFAQNYLSFLLMGALFLIVLLMGSLIPPFMDVRNLNNIFMQFCYFAAIAVAAAVSSRAKGPDLSVGSIVAFSGIILALGTASSSAGYSLIFCVLVGALNGVLIVYAKIPAIITTLMTGTLLRGINLILCGGKNIPVQNEVSFGSTAGSGILLMSLVLAFAIVLVFFTKLGLPFHKRTKENGMQKISYLLAYVASAVFAAIVGFYMVGRLRNALPTMGSGLETFILFVYITVTSSKLLDTKIAALLYALVPALVWAIFTNTTSIIGLSAYNQMILQAVIVLAFGAVKYATDKKTILS